MVLVSVSVLFPPSVCLNDIYLGLGSRVATFWERAAHLVNRMFSLYFVILVISHFGFEGGTLVLIASAPGQYFQIKPYGIAFN